MCKGINNFGNSPTHGMKRVLLINGQCSKCDYIPHVGFWCHNYENATFDEVYNGKV